MTSFWPAQRGHVEPGHPLPRGPGARHPARAHGPSPGGQGPGQGGKSPWPEPRNAVGSYGALTPGLQDPGRGLSPGPPDAPARRETVAGERSRGTEERSGPPGRALAGSAFLGHSPQAALSLTWALARNGPGFHSPPPPHPGCPGLRPRLAPRGQRIGIRSEDAASGSPLLGSEKRPLPPLLPRPATGCLPPGTRFFRLHPRPSREATALGRTCGVPVSSPLASS